MKIITTVFLLCFLFPFRLAAALVLHLSANVEADVFVNGRKKKMKKFCLPLAFPTAACAKITDMYVPVHIGANTNRGNISSPCGKAADRSSIPCPFKSAT